jgi:hypothetical protein
MNINIVAGDIDAYRVPAVRATITYSIIQAMSVRRPSCTKTDPRHVIIPGC